MKIKVGTIAVVSYVTVVQNLLKRLSIYVPLVFSRQKVPNSDLDPNAEPESKDYILKQLLRQTFHISVN